MDAKGQNAMDSALEKDERTALLNGLLHADHVFQLLLMDPRSREALRAYLERGRAVEGEVPSTHLGMRRSALLSARQAPPSQE